MLKEIPNFKHYLVDEEGNVFRKREDRYVRLKKTTNSHGYNIVRLYNEDCFKTFYVARLVAQAFFSAFDINDKEVLVQHNNSIRTDDRLVNLGLTNKKDSANRPLARRNRQISLESSTKFQKIKHLSNEEKKENIVVGEVFYESISEAARNENVSRRTVRNRANSKNFPNWKFVKDYRKELLNVKTN